MLILRCTKMYRVYRSMSISYRVVQVVRIPDGHFAAISPPLRRHRHTVTTAATPLPPMHWATESLPSPAIQVICCSPCPRAGSRSSVEGISGAPPPPPPPGAPPPPPPSNPSELGTAGAAVVSSAQPHCGTAQLSRNKGGHRY